MGGCKGLHCDGCGGGGGVGAVIALLVIIALALRAAWPTIVSAVEIAAWTVAGVTGTAVGPPRLFRTASFVLFHAASCRVRYSSWASCGVR